MATLKDVPNKVSSSTQTAIPSRKTYDENKIQDPGKDFSIFEETYTDDEQNISSYVKDSESEIISMYETASLFLSCQKIDYPDFDSPFTAKPDSTYSCIGNLNYSSHQNQSKDDFCPQEPISRCVSSMRMKQYTYQSMPPAMAKEQTVNHCNSEDTKIEGPIFSKPLESFSIFPLDVENSLPLLVIQSDEKENSYPCRQISPLDSLPLSSILNTRKLLGHGKAIRNEDVTNLHMSEAYTSSQASMINIYTPIPSSSSFVPRKLQQAATNHHYYNEESCFGGYNPKKPLSYSTQTLIKCNRSLKNEKRFSQNSLKVSNTFHNSSEVNSFMDRSNVNILHFASLSMPQIAQKSPGVTTNDSYSKFPIEDNEENHLDIRESKYQRHRTQDSRFDLSTYSNKCLDSHRISYTTIDQIEMDLNSKTNEASPQMICCESLNALSSCESIGYTTSTRDRISKKSQCGQANSKLKINKKCGSSRLLNPLETKKIFREAAFSRNFSRTPSSQLASKNKTSTIKISSSMTEISKTPLLLISSENYMRYGLKVNELDTTSLGSDSLNQRKILEDYDMNCLDNSGLIFSPENRNQDCKDLEYDKFARDQSYYALDKTAILPIYDYKITTPKFIPSLKQMKLEKSRPQLKKSFPPLPAVEYAEARKHLSIKDEISDPELSLRFSPRLAGFKTSSLKTEFDESPGLKSSLPLEPLMHTDMEADKKIAQKIKSYNHDNSNNNQLKRSPPKLRLKPKKLQSFPSCPSISVHLDSMPHVGCSIAAASSNTKLDLDKSNILKSTRLRLKYSQAQNHCNGTVRIRRAPKSVTFTANLPHSNPSDLFTSREYSNDVFGETINNLDSRRPSLESDNLISCLSVSNIKTNDRKRIKKKQSFSDSPKGYLRPLDSSNFFGSKIGISGNSPQIENYDEMRINFGNSRYRKERLSTTLKHTRSKDEIRYRSSNNLEFHSIRTPKSTPNLQRNYNESVPCLKKQPQGQKLKVKIRDWIKSAKSAISIHIESQKKVWRKKNEVL